MGLNLRQYKNVETGWSKLEKFLDDIIPARRPTCTGICGLHNFSPFPVSDWCESRRPGHLCGAVNFYPHPRQQTYPAGMCGRTVSCARIHAWCRFEGVINMRIANKNCGPKKIAFRRGTEVTISYDHMAHPPKLIIMISFCIVYFCGFINFLFSFTLKRVW